MALLVAALQAAAAPWTYYAQGLPLARCSAGRLDTIDHPAASSIVRDMHRIKIKTREYEL